MKHLNIILSHFWKRWRREYLSELRDAHRSSSKAYTGDRSPNVGDIVVVHDDNHPRLMWKLGKVEGLLEGHDGVVRGALVRVRSRTGSIVLKRPVQLLYPLEIHSCEEKGKEDTVNCVQEERETVVPEAPVRHSTRDAAHQAKKRLKLLVEDSDSEID